MSAKDSVVRTLREEVGRCQDNLHRARAAVMYRPHTADKLYGESGKTLNQIVAEYQEALGEAQAALAWAEKQEA